MIKKKKHTLRNENLTASCFFFFFCSRRRLQTGSRRSYGQRGGVPDGRTDRRVDRQTGGETDRWTDRHRESHTEGWTDRVLYRDTDGWTELQMDGQMEGWMYFIGPQKEVWDFVAL